ncbi:MAG: hypothetical protein D6768_17765 [Chloroflexi bacterium]|nr:MAG: hypothetical protein D6768_17765 [Chloroflexota bacterium]
MSIGGVGGSLASAAGIEKLIQQTMAMERQPLNRLESQKDDLEVKRGIYNDVSSKLENLRTALQNITGDSGALNSYVPTIADEDILGVSVTNSYSLVAGKYDVTVTRLAKAHQIASAQQGQADVALGLSGNFVVGGAATRSATAGTTNAVVTGFGTGSIRSGELELGSRDYSVEFQQNGSTWQFRIVDENGEAVSIDDASDAGTEMTSGWQDLSLVQGTTFDTGRGLTVTFSSTDPTQSHLFGGAGTAKTSYTAQGATINVSATSSLNDIRNAINAATFAEGNEIQATVVDRKLVLSAKESGLNAQITLDDTSGSVLQTLGILSASGGGSGGTLAAGAEVQPAQDAQFSVNGISITRSSNSGITGVIQGVSLDLTLEGTTSVTLAKNHDDVVSKFKEMLEAYNDVASHLKAKTEPQLDATATGDNPTYIAAPLGRDMNMRTLRFDLSSDLLSIYSGAASGAPTNLTDLGITLDENLSFSLSDEDALTAALNENFEDVSDLMDYVFGRMEDRLETYLDGSSSYISSAKDSIDDQIDLLDTRIDSYESRLSAREEALRKQYYELQSQLITMQYDYQSTMSIASGSMNILYG